MSITRDDIDEAGSVVCDCKLQEESLIQRYGLEGKPRDDQESACPELKIIRERRMKAFRFLAENN